MAERLDKHGHLLRIGDPVRLPSQRGGHVRGFVVAHGRVRVLVRYDNHAQDDVKLQPHLLERLRWTRAGNDRKGTACRGAGRAANRRPQGELHYRASLSDDQVRQMRKRHHVAGTGYGTLALMFDCGVSTARDICTKRTRRNA